MMAVGSYGNLMATGLPFITKHLFLTIEGNYPVMGGFLFLVVGGDLAFDMIDRHPFHII